MRRRLTALLTAVLLAVTLIPMTAWAELVETVDADFAVEAVEVEAVEAVEIEEIEEVAEITEEEGELENTENVSTGNLLGDTDPKYFAQIGEDKYESFGTALDAWDAGETLTLLADVETTAVKVLSSKGYVLNLSNYTWTAKDCDAIKLTSTGGLTINAGENGGITATKGSCDCIYADGSNPLYINGGIYNGDIYVSKNTVLVYSGVKTRELVRSAHDKKVYFNDINAILFDGQYYNYLTAAPATWEAKVNAAGVFTRTDDYEGAGPTWQSLAGYDFYGKAVVYFIEADDALSLYTDTVGDALTSGTKKYYADNDKTFLADNCTFTLNSNATATVGLTINGAHTVTMDASTSGASYTGKVVLNDASAKFIEKYGSNTEYADANVTKGSSFGTDKVIAVDKATANQKTFTIGDYYACQVMQEGQPGYVAITKEEAPTAYANDKLWIYTKTQAKLNNNLLFSKFNGIPDYVKATDTTQYKYSSEAVSGQILYNAIMRTVPTGGIDYGPVTLESGQSVFYTLGAPEDKPVNYKTFNEAYEAANGKPIILLDNLAPEMVLEAGKSFTVDPNGFTFTDTDVTAPDGYKVVKTVNEDGTVTYSTAEVTYVTVTFDAQGGTPEPAPQTVEEGQKAGMPEPDPEKEGFTFAGWYNGEVAYDFTEPVNEDLTLTAKWEEVIPEYTVTFDAQGGSPEPEKQTIEKGKSAKKPEADPEKDGYDFIGWYNGEAAYDFADPVNGNLSLTAKWKEKQLPAEPEVFIFTFNYCTGESVSKEVKEGETAQRIADPVREGYQFAGWYADENLTKEYDFTALVTADTIVYAKWANTQTESDLNLSGNVSDIEIAAAPKNDEEKSAVEEIKENKNLQSAETVKTLIDAINVDKLPVKEDTTDIRVIVDVNLEGVGSDAETGQITNLTYRVEPHIIELDKSGAVIGEKQKLENKYLNNRYISVKLPIPSGVKATYAIINHISSDGSSSIIKPYPEIVNAGTKDAYVVIKIRHFSEFEITFTNEQIVMSSGSSEKSEPLFTGTWNNPVKGGAWTQDAHGIWHYATSQTFRNTWGYIFNPYAKEGQHTSDWFWFDAKGNMLTGWQFINGKWYYLNPNKDGTLGACQLGGVTPDGWTVDESGAWIESIPKK